MKFKPLNIATLLGGWLALADLLVWLAQLTNAWPVQALTWLCLSFLPGVALLRLLRLQPRSVLEGILYSLGLSVLVLMLSGLAANQILWAVGIARPLELAGIWGFWNLVTIACIVAGLVVNRQVLHTGRAHWPKVSKVTMLAWAGSLCVPFVAMFGAFRLNNGGDALVAETAIGAATVIIIYMFAFRNRLSNATLAWCIFAIGLSVLLMTALRGWDITGHDIMREFRVYTMTHVSGRWDIAAYRDPYNACLSITILPEVYAKLLHTSGLVVFKCILQILLAVCPVVIYVLLRRFVSKLGALVGCGLFISYPTFINDSAMLTRQGVAYLFFALALLVALHASREKVHKVLFVLCGLGVVLSHYSTSYMFVAIFGAALLCKFCTQRIRGWRMQWRGDKFSVLSPGMVVLLALATFLWYSQFTGTANGLMLTITRSVANIPHLLSADNKSADTSSALLLSTHKTQVDIYQSYLAQQPEVGNKVAEAAQYTPQITADDIPTTPLGKHLDTVGTQPSVTADLRQNFAKLLQLLAALSVVYATYLSVFYATYSFARKKPFTLPLDLMCLSVAGIVLLVAMVALPTLSLNYGVLRTFQQLLIFLVVPLVILLTRWGRLLQPRLRTLVATTSMAALFVLFSGLLAQVLGGVSAPLTLNNHGLYYGLYYTTTADLQAYSWMKAHIPANQDVRAAGFAKAIMHDPRYPFSKTGILPTQKPTGTYVYLDQAQIVAHTFYVNYDGSPLITTFPVDYYSEWTNQLYSTPTTGVYR